MKRLSLEKQIDVKLNYLCRVGSGKLLGVSEVRLMIKRGQVCHQSQHTGILKPQLFMALFSVTLSSICLCAALEVSLWVSRIILDLGS